MKILVDVMGGDLAPLETVKGVCAAAKEYPAEYVVIGDREQTTRSGYMVLPMLFLIH